MAPAASKSARLELGDRHVANQLPQGRVELAGRDQPRARSTVAGHEARPEQRLRRRFLAHVEGAYGQPQPVHSHIRSNLRKVCDRHTDHVAEPVVRDVPADAAPEAERHTEQAECKRDRRQHIRQPLAREWPLSGGGRRSHRGGGGDHRLRQCCLDRVVEAPLLCEYEAHTDEACGEQAEKKQADHQEEEDGDHCSQREMAGRERAPDKSSG
eukprot:scaffold12262_cov121-Isochrysis_galbana.AAC.4